MKQSQRPVVSAGHPEMLLDVRAGLTRPQKELSSRYFYDHHGSRLFEQITRLPEYYLTRTERQLLADLAPGIVERTGCRTLVELGAGSAEKTRFILDAMSQAGTGRTYVPIDVSAAFLAEAAQSLRAEYPELHIVPVVADMAQDSRLRRYDGPVLFALLGSTIGNFNEIHATRLLRRVRGLMQPDDRFLLGADLRKDVSLLEAAYNDAQSVTARFNLNILRVLNRELGADFDLAAFEHRARYEQRFHRIEMHLVSRRDQQVTIPGMERISLDRGETIRTEISCKYDRPSLELLFTAAGLQLEEWHADAEQLCSLALGRVHEPSVAIGTSSRTGRSGRRRPASARR